MLKIVLSNRFKKDLKLAKKRGLNLEISLPCGRNSLTKTGITDLPETISAFGNAMWLLIGYLSTGWKKMNLSFFYSAQALIQTFLVNSCSKKREGLPLVFSHHPRQKNLTVVNIGTDLVVVYIQKFRLLHDSSGRQVIELTDSLSDGIRICIAISNTSVSETR